MFPTVQTLKKWRLCLLSGFLFAGCHGSKQPVDLLVHHAVVYTVNDGFRVAEAFAVKEGRFVAVGSNDELRDRYVATQTLDAGGKPVYPGFIDAHCHFLGYGLSLRQANLVGTRSFAEVVEKVAAHRRNYPAAAWIQGRGWDQNDWARQSFPTKDTLDALFPDVPVLLTRVDGHAALANQKALDLAGVTVRTRVDGGKLEIKNGRLTGILVDNAVGLVSRMIPPPGRAGQIAALQNAERNCFAVGLTTVDDAGLDKDIVDVLDSLHRTGGLSMRVYAMLNPTPRNQAHYLTRGPYKTDRLNVRSFKVYADGALGSRGACLLEDYGDAPGERGFLLRPPDYYRQLADTLYRHNFQMNTHCIGDSANRFLLDVYGAVLKGHNDRRWRIEHAQVVSAEDVEKFGRFSVVPSVQPTHGTSDMYWAGERLGRERVKTAYAYRALYQQNQRLAFGSDFPVEDIRPLYGFHAAVVRQDAKEYPVGGFQPENALSRENALRGMTIWAAYSNFEEKEKGSIEPGKFADFVVLEEDVMQAAPARLRNAAVLRTFVNGKQVYARTAVNP
ncbi:MAG: amidohydrolase [Ferruginibacter sp.]|nr:amidohydrolase [Cytophagales bacterium]